MRDDPNPRIAIGDNSGEPAEIVRDQVAAIFAALNASGKTFEERKAELIVSAGRAVITDNDSVGRAGDLQGMIARLLETVEHRVTEIVEPYRMAVVAARAQQDRFGADLVAANGKVRAAVDQFRSDQRAKAAAAAEQQRADEAARRAALALEAAPAAAEPTVIALPAVKGDFGSRTGDRKVKTFAWADPRKVDLKVLNHSAVKKAMEQACRDLAKVQDKIKGVIITEGAATTVRTKV